MNFSPPTDSLYKFSAIVGSVLVVLSFYFTEKTLVSYNREILHASLEHKVVSVEVDSLTKKVNRLEKLRDNSIAMEKKGYKLDPTKLHIYYSDKEIKQLAEQIFSDSDKVKMKIAKLEGIKENIEFLKNELHRMLKWIFVGLVLGGCLALFGYVNWYLKIQVYQDKSIKLSAEAEDAAKKE